MSTSRRQASPIAAKKAAELVEELCVDHPEHIDVEAIAMSIGAAVIYRELRHEQGRLVRSKGRGSAVISIREELRGTPQGRFVTAHEIGHLRCHPQLDQFKLCTSRDMSDYWNSGVEAEANQFAAELLMPRRLFEQRCGEGNPSLQQVRGIATDFRTSLMATGIRFVRFCPAVCAFVFSRDAEIVWAARSESFTHFIQKGWQLPAGDAGSLAADLHAGRPVRDRMEPIDADNWTDSRSASGRSFWEHSIPLADDASGGVLTLLWDREA